MTHFDIRQYKTDLRLKYRSIRTNMPPEVKAQKDHAILRRLEKTREWRRAKLVLTYVSTPIEVDTRQLIEKCWAEGKRVAVPRCVDDTRRMYFYEITSWDQLESHTFGVLEPIPSICSKVTRFGNAICIVPGLTFDKDGYRLGYGKGYYDRFLSTYCTRTPKIGLCYIECIRKSLYHGQYDVACNIVVNDKYTRFIRTKKN